MANDNQPFRSNSGAVAMALSLGLLGGLVFGLLVLDSIGLDIALGLCAGAAVTGIVTARRPVTTTTRTPRACVMS